MKHLKYILSTSFILAFNSVWAFAITYPAISSFLYGNTAVNAPPEKAFVKGEGYPYRLLLPRNFDLHRKYPVIIFLHGGGETGSDNERQLTAGRNSANGGLSLVSTADPDTQTNYPCIFAAPQMPVNNWYNAGSVQAVKDLINIIKTQYPDAVDVDRICLTGLSSGGMGSWNIPPQITPNPFSCIVPMSAFSIYPDTTPKMPIWTFHAVNDPVESIYRGNRRPGQLGTDVIVPLLRGKGYSIIYTRYNTGGHNIWITAYQHPLLLPWMFAQRLGQPMQGVPGLSIEGSSVDANKLTLWGNVTEKAGFTRVGWATSSVGRTPQKTDGVADGSTSFVSASSMFDASFVGQRLGIPNRNADQGIVYYDITAVSNPTTVTLSANVREGTYPFMVCPFGTMENPMPGSGVFSPQWKLAQIPIPDKTRQVQVIAEGPTGIEAYGGLMTINQMFTIGDAAAPPQGAAGQRGGSTPSAPSAGTSPPVGAAREHNFARWERDIAAFEAADRANPPPKGAVLFVGASTITLWKSLAQDFPDHQVINRGFGGSEIVDSTHFADRIIIPYEPRTIFLRSGSNEISAGKSPQQVLADFEAFVAKIREKLPETEIVYISINPIPSRWSQNQKNQVANQLIREAAEKLPKVKFLDIWDISITVDGKPREDLFGRDRLHFNEQGYKLLAERVGPFMPPSK
jgi:lysophospholipase L1-like esterase/poly(3-hydroxybutyrate) depolymerase